MNNIMDDFSRQINIFDPEEFNKPVHVIGAGAVGSWLAFSLAKMGIQNIHIYDFDEVGMHNLPNQLFGLHDIDGNKAIKIANIIRKFTGYRVRGRNVKVDGTQPLQGIVFMLTDTMASRKKIYDMSIRNNPNIDLLIETRMDLRGGRIYAIDPKNIEQTKRYEETLYSDDESEVSACGVSQTVLPTAIGIVSNAIWKLLNYINEEDFPNETLVDFSNEIIITQTWKTIRKRKKITFDDVNGIMIRCKEECEAKEMMEIYNELEIRWSGGANTTERALWEIYEKDTYYIVCSDKRLKYGDYRQLDEVDKDRVIDFKNLVGE